ncbi:MAG: HAD-IC family P-type ATPase [Nanoarchaeota archaeon]|nr:HAD-IC family P-type ATPase [Nanoarchaeota archaeon]MBU1103052.1 HAD-IC family P-type ATPase [Nanoarchaeota archaeon]
MKKEEENFHAKTSEQVLKELDSTLSGLTKEQAKTRQLKYGLNKIPEKKPSSKILIFLRQFKSLMVYVLLVAGVISFFLERMIDVYVIVGVILINSVIGFSQENKAENAIKALKKMIVPLARLYRSNDLVQIPAKELVPGDIIILEEGDKIPADARLLEIKNFKTVESSLTGESLPVEKSLKIVPEKTSLSDQKNMVWLGTFVASGKAKAIVVATGANTAIGKLAESIEKIEPKKSHFKEKTDTLAKHLAIIAFAGAALTFLVGFFFRDLEFSEIFLFTIASLVSGIPEGLPVVLAVVLAIGAFRMAKRKAIIRSKYATESLGIINTIITDKTGTITENTMTVQKILLPGQKEISVTGAGWTPKGEFFQNEKQIEPLQNKHLEKLIQVVYSCNNSKLFKEQNNEESYKIIGDPTEAALTVLAEKAGLKKVSMSEKEKRLDDLPFNPKLKYHASLSVLTEQNKEKQVYVVGAPESVLQHSTYVLKNNRKAKLTEADIAAITKNINALTDKAMRVLGVAYREVSQDLTELKEEHTKELIFVGIVGMLDPPREEVKGAIAKAEKAGIRVIMATGDHKNTAIAIAKEIGLIKSQNKDYPLALTGEELEQMSSGDFEKAVNNVSVFARLSPEIKLKIAKTLQKKGDIVAMTGDGVNDAPALKQADVGVSMGIIGTDVARESSEMILADDNFASIISAIEEGRTVFVNTKQTSLFLVATSIAEYTTIISTMTLGLPLPLLPTQILWLNLVTGGVTDMALATEQSHHDVLNEKPRNKKENILNKDLLPHLVIVTLTMLALTLVFFYYHLPDQTKARTAAFAAMSFTQLFAMFNFRSLNKSLFKIKVFSNKYIIGAFVVSAAAMLVVVYLPFLQNVFQFTALSLTELLTIFALSSSTLWFGEIYKLWKKKSIDKK